MKKTGFTNLQLKVLLFVVVVLSFVGFQNINRPNQAIGLGINGHPVSQVAYSNSMGVNYAEQINLLQSAGAQWYRFDLAVSATALTPIPIFGKKFTIPTANNGQNFEQLDLLLALAQAKGIQLLPVLIPNIDRTDQSPAGLKTIYNKSLSAAYNFVSRYKNSIHVWELSNEEDNNCLISYPGAGNGDQISDYNIYTDPIVKGKNGNPTPTSVNSYLVTWAVLKGLSDGVHQADPTALRIIDFAGWLHTEFLQLLQQTDPNNNPPLYTPVPYDIVGVHWYGGMGEITCPGQSLPCTPPIQHFNVIQRIQTITSGKPMWMTETNYTPIVSDPGANITAEEAYLPTTLQTYLNSPATYPFQNVFVYELLDEPALANPNFPNDHADQAQMGLYQDTLSSTGHTTVGAPKPAYLSVQKLFYGK